MRWNADFSQKTNDPTDFRPGLTSQIGQKQMTQTVQFSEYGGTDVLKVVDTLPLTAGPGQVRLAVRAAGINPVDWKMLQGQMREMIPLTLPSGLGSDVAGVVSQVGAGVTRSRWATKFSAAHSRPPFLRSCSRTRQT